MGRHKHFHRRIAKQGNLEVCALGALSRIFELACRAWVGMSTPIDGVQPISHGTTIHHLSTSWLFIGILPYCDTFGYVHVSD